MHMNIVINNWGSFGSIHFFYLSTGYNPLCMMIMQQWLFYHKNTSELISQQQR